MTFPLQPPFEAHRTGAIGAGLPEAISPLLHPDRSQTWEAMDTYFECITTCSIEDGECVTRCVEQLRSPA